MPSRIADEGEQAFGKGESSVSVGPSNSCKADPGTFFSHLAPEALHEARCLLLSMKRRTKALFPHPAGPLTTTSWALPASANCSSRAMSASVRC